MPGLIAKFLGLCQPPINLLGNLAAFDATRAANDFLSSSNTSTNFIHRLKGYLLRRDGDMINTIRKLKSALSMLYDAKTQAAMLMLKHPDRQG
jgi:hypothetical protein